jgi:predicted amidohydrolase
MRVAFIQMAPEFGNSKYNVEKAIAMINNCPADLYVLPELFNTGYVFASQDELADLAEPAETGFACKTLRQFARDKNIGLVFGFAEKAPQGVFNSSAFVDHTGAFKLYRKLHLFFLEKKYFLPGNLPLEVFQFRRVKLGMMVCFDWIYPEVTRCLALMGADIVCHPANLVMPYCQEAMKTRSLENRIYTVTANRIGLENRAGAKMNFTGKSQITDCKGNVIYRAAENKEEIYGADIKIEEARSKNINNINNLWIDRRVEYYNRLGDK